MRKLIHARADMPDNPTGQAGQTSSAGQTAAGTAAEASQTVSDAGRALAEQFAKRIAEMQSLVIPDVDALTTGHRRNMEALSAAYRATLEGAQAVARRNAEIMQQAMAEMQEAVKAVASAQAPEEKAAKQLELLKAAYQHSVANMKELTELIQKANAEALGLLSRRFSEGMDEVKELMERFGSKPGS
jgi:phasin family protein